MNLRKKIQRVNTHNSLLIIMIVEKINKEARKVDVIFILLYI
jgi:hypothetical protein